MKRLQKKIAVVGTVGLPANYGGFETLVENLVRFHDGNILPYDVTVYCSSKSYSEKLQAYLSAKLKYIPLNANGAQSIVYDWISLLLAMWRADVILLLGVSGATMLPLVRLLSSAKVVTNIDGIEWRRQKWKGLAKWFLRLSEKMAVRFSHEVIADNGAIAKYVEETYGVETHVIAYGGDHAVGVEAAAVDELGLPDTYAFSVCRIEPENNVHMIVQAFAKQTDFPLVIVGNWDSSGYGKQLRKQYVNVDHIYLLDPIYDLGKLYTLRSKSKVYVHGHSAGGTNPSLVEAMHFGKPILAFDCSFNRKTTDNEALFFKSEGDLKHLLNNFSEAAWEDVASKVLDVAKQRYVWQKISKQYFNLF